MPSTATPAGAAAPTPAAVQHTARQLAVYLVDCANALDNPAARVIDDTPGVTASGELSGLPAEIDRAAGVDVPHTEHPLRHYDRTCPACNPGVTVGDHQTFRASDADAGEGIGHE